MAIGARRTGTTNILTRTLTPTITTMARRKAPMTGHAESAASEGLALLRLLQLASPALPVGAFAYSQGLESAVTAGLVTDETTASEWILGLLQGPFAGVDLAIFVRLHAAFASGDAAAADRWNAFLMASRASAVPTSGNCT